MDEATLAITPFKRAEDERFGVKAPEKGKRRCIVVVPKQPAPGNPWSWRGCYWDHEPQAEVELLRRGFHVAFITPDPGKQWDAWYAYLTEKHGLSKKPAFVGMSKGGVNAYEWAAAHPDKVSCIYADNPAIRPESLREARRPGQERRRPAERLRQPGFPPGAAHAGHRGPLPPARRPDHRDDQGRPGPPPPQPAQPQADRRLDRRAHPPAPATGPTSPTRPSRSPTITASRAHTPPSSEEKTYATCRGPGFVECYDRYDARTDSQWGLAGMAVIVPKAAAPGKPWVFRADPIGRDAAVDQALLAQGLPHRHRPAHRPGRPGPAAVGRDLQAARRPRLLPQAGAWRAPGRRPAKPMPGPSRTRTRSPASTPRTPPSAASCRRRRRSTTSRPGQGGRAAHPRLREPRPLAGGPDARRRGAIQGTRRVGCRSSSSKARGII